MNYQDLKTKLQAELPKRKPTYQYIDVRYDEDDQTFVITWENEAGHLGTLAMIKDDNVTFHDFDDMESIALIMQFAHQSLGDKLYQHQVTSINYHDLEVIDKLVQFYDVTSQTLYYQQLAHDKLRLTDDDIKSIKQFINTNQGMFRIINGEYNL